MPDAEPITDDQRRAFVDAAHRIARAGLLRYSSGNLSCRLDGPRVAISATRSWLGEIRPDQIAVFDLDADRYVNDVKGSVESGVHFGVLRARPTVNVVLHFQSPAATALCCSADPAGRDYNVIPEVPYYIGPVGHVGWHMPGTPELAAAVTDVMRDHDLAMMAGHGLVVCGRDYADATQKAGFFELACEVLLSGAPVRPLPADAIAQLLTGGGYGGKTPG